MKPALFSLLLATLPVLGSAQEAVKLTEAQFNNVIEQLKKLEEDITRLRGDNLTSVLQRLRDAASSDQSALKLYLDCDSLVNNTRKEGTRSEARAREEQMKKGLERKGGNGANEEEGNFGVAVRLQIQYLILTLEAHETKEEELKKMVPKLKSFIGEMVAAAPKLKGRALQHVNQPIAGGRGSVIVEAFQLDRYLKVPNWTARPTDFGGMYSQTILPLARAESNTLLAGLWDERINAEANFRKETMFAPEFELWTRNDLPDLRWERATFLYANGPDPVTAMAEMLRLIKDNASHANAPNWLKELRTLVQQSAPTATQSAELTKSTGT
jgi:hypothetical protein